MERRRVWRTQLLSLPVRRRGQLLERGSDVFFGVWGMWERGGWVLWRDWEKCLHQGRGALTQQAGGGREQVSAETTFYQGDHQQQGGAPAWRVVSIERGQWKKTRRPRPSRSRGSPGSSWKNSWMQQIREETRQATEERISSVLETGSCQKYSRINVAKFKASQLQ